MVFTLADRHWTVTNIISDIFLNTPELEQTRLSKHFGTRIIFNQSHVNLNKFATLHMHSKSISGSQSRRRICNGCSSPSFYSSVPIVPGSYIMFHISRYYNMKCFNIYIYSWTVIYCYLLQCLI